MSRVTRVLKGFTVGITSDRSKDRLASEFESRGAAVVLGSGMQTRVLRFSVAMREASERIASAPPDALIVVTGLGFEYWAAALREWDLLPFAIEALGRTRIYGRGPKANAAIQAAGLTPVISQPPERLRDVVDVVVEDLRPGARVAVLVDGSGSAPELARLREAGLDAELIATYTWGPAPDRRPALRLAEGVIAGRVHAVIFTARPAVRNWFNIATEEGIDSPLRSSLAGGQVTIGCIGPVCADAVVAEGVDPRVVVVPTSHQISALVETVGEKLKTRVMRTSRSGAAGVELAGTVATIGGKSYRLSPAEARLLAALVGSPDAVVTPSELLRSVWEGAAQDPQLIEVVVARLRRRLGDNANVITSVPRRGYSLKS